MNIRAWLKIEDKYILQCRLNVEPFTDHLTTASVTWFDINYWKTIETFLKPLLKQCLNHLKESEVNVKFFGATPYDIDDVSLQLKYELKRRTELNNTVVQPKFDKAAWENIRLEEEKEYLDYGGLFETVIVLDYVLHVSIKKIGTLQKDGKINEVNLKEETSAYFQNNQNSSLNSLETLKSSLPHMKYEKKKRKCTSKVENKSDQHSYESNKEMKIDQFLTFSSSEEKFTQLKLDNPMEIEDISSLPTYTTCSQTDEFSNPKKVKDDKPKKKTKESKMITQKKLNKYFETKPINHSKSQTKPETKSCIKDFSLSPKLYETSTNKIIERPDPYHNDSLKENLNINFAYTKKNSFCDTKDSEEYTRCDDLVDFRDKLRKNKLKKIKKKKNLSMRKVTIDKNKTISNTLKCINTNAEENDSKFAEENCKNITSEEEISDDQLSKLRRLFNDIVSHKASEKNELSNYNLEENMILDNENDKQLTSEEKPVEKFEWLGKLKKSCLKNIIQKNWSKLKDIECGRAYSRRHQDYFRGGRAKIDLTFQVHVSQFTEKQIDYIMNLLIPEFYKGGYEDMDYILKVILPETLIIVHMELYGTTHKESDRLMSEAVFKVCTSD